jgi:hypothetical protein
VRVTLALRSSAKSALRRLGDRTSTFGGSNAATSMVDGMSSFHMLGHHVTRRPAAWQIESRHGRRYSLASLFLVDTNGAPVLIHAKCKVVSRVRMISSLPNRPFPKRDVKRRS